LFTSSFFQGVFERTVAHTGNLDGKGYHDLLPFSSCPFLSLSSSSFPIALHKSEGDLPQTPQHLRRRRRCGHNADEEEEDDVGMIPVLNAVVTAAAVAADTFD
jgi:hypothetical protein